MQGRVENERRMDEYLSEKLKDKPAYMTEYMKTFARKSYTTKRAYINYILEFIDYLKREYGYNIDDIHVFSNVKPSIINGYLDYLNRLEYIAPNGKLVRNGEGIQCRKFFAIKNFFKFLLNDEYITKNPCDNVEPPKVDNEAVDIIAMNKKEINLFLKNVLNGAGSKRAKATQKKWKNRDYAIMTLALALGLRVTSISEINVEDVDFENQTLTVTEKGNRTRKLMLSDNLVDTLQQWLEDREEMLKSVGIDCDAMFISCQKTRLTSKAIENLVTKYSVGIEQHITPHKLRSTCATNVYTATGDIYLTASVLGHRNIQNTKRYAKIVDEKKEKAMRAMDKIIFG